MGGHNISEAEERFWQRMTFRQFAVVLVRMQAVWFLFYAVEMAMYLPSYFARIPRMASSAGTELGHAFFWALFRLIWHVAGAVVCIRYADRIVSWLVKDLVPKPPPGAGTEPKDLPQTPH